MADFYLISSVVLLYFSACFSSWSTLSYFKYLKMHYIDTWKSLGCPERNVYLNREVNEAVNQFEKNKEYLKFHDPILEKKILFKRMGEYVTYFFLCYFVVLMILHYYKK